MLHLKLLTVKFPHKSKPSLQDSPRDKAGKPGWRVLSSPPAPLPSDSLMAPRVPTGPGVRTACLFGLSSGVTKNKQTKTHKKPDTQ